MAQQQQQRSKEVLKNDLTDRLLPDHQRKQCVGKILYRALAVSEVAGSRLSHSGP
jgi:hypothetical protein